MAGRGGGGGVGNFLLLSSELRFRGLYEGHEGFRRVASGDELALGFVGRTPCTASAKSFVEIVASLSI